MSGQAEIQESWGASIGARRAEAIRRVLSNTSQRMTTDEIATSLRAGGDGHLIDVAAVSETIAEILRDWERAGEADKVRAGRRWLWGLRHPREETTG